GGGGSARGLPAGAHPPRPRGGAPPHAAPRGPPAQRAARGTGPFGPKGFFPPAGRPATPIRPASSASSISLTKTPREPISPNGFDRSLSPAVVIATSAISVPSPRSDSAAPSACVSARPLPHRPPRIPVTTPSSPLPPLP